MELLERYLQAVSRHLPRRRQADILAELRVNLEAQLEDKEAELGRGLKQGEAEDWLRELGSPMQVAARYLPQQWLIGPRIFPVYWYVLRLALLWALAVYAVVAVVQVVVGHGGGFAVAGAVGRGPYVLFEVAAWVTLVFAAMEFFAARFPAKSAGLMQEMTEWSPASLPKLEKLHPSPEPKSHAHAVAEVVFGALFLVWLLLIPHYPFLLLGPGWELLRHSSFAIAPGLMAFYYWVVALNVLQVAWRGVALVSGAWQRGRRVQHLVLKAFGLIPLGVLLTAPGHRLLLLKHPVLDGAHYGATVATVNHGLHQGLLVVLAIVLLQLAWDGWQWARRLREGAEV